LFKKRVLDAAVKFAISTKKCLDKTTDQWGPIALKWRVFWKWKSIVEFQEVQRSNQGVYKEFDFEQVQLRCFVL